MVISFANNPVEAGLDRQVENLAPTLDPRERLAEGPEESHDREAD